jgi:hypothetical protein
MIMKPKTYIRMIAAFVSLSAIVGCSPNSEEAEAAEFSNPLESIHILDEKPSGALSVRAAREKLKPGDVANVVGQIGGVDDPFLEGYAGFVLADTDVMFCDEMGDDDHCATPWDACCEDPDKLKVSRASVQFVNADGYPIKKSIKGYRGLEGLSEVVVVGTVAENSTADNLMIQATGIYAQ